MNKPERNYCYYPLQERTYCCSACMAPLFEAEKQYEAGCGFPSFWEPIAGQVKERFLSSYQQKRIQLICNNCGQHLGHVFQNRFTPTQLRYCLKKEAITSTPA